MPSRVGVSTRRLGSRLPPARTRSWSAPRAWPRSMAATSGSSRARSRQRASPSPSRSSRSGGRWAAHRPRNRDSRRLARTRPARIGSGRPAEWGGRPMWPTPAQSDSVLIPPGIDTRPEGGSPIFHTKATRTSATAIAAFALAVLTLATSLSDEAFGAARSAGTDPTRIESVQDAVRLGIVDREVVDQLRGSGEAVGVVSHDEDAKQPRLSARDEALVEADYDQLSTVVMRFRTESALLRAARRAGVERISASQTGSAHTEQSLAIVGQPAVYQAGNRGRGTYVAVLDTGVDAARYPAYFPAGSFAGSYDASGANGRALSFGHGTHVASTVLRVAPATRIISVDVFDWNGTAQPQWNSAAILRGVNYLIGLKKQYLADNTRCCNVVAMNLSLGTGNTYRNEFCTDSLGFKAAYDVGIIPVVSSGNDATRSGSFQKGVSYPACSSYALSVGATTDGTYGQSNRCEASSGADRLTSFSQTGPT